MTQWSLQTPFADSFCIVLLGHGMAEECEPFLSEYDCRVAVVVCSITLGVKLGKKYCFLKTSADVRLAVVS